MNTFTEGKIVKPLITFALPVLLALFLQSLYGAVDLLIVGQFGSSADVSAVATGSQMMHMITCVITGLAMGSTILLGQFIGSKQDKEASRTIGATIVLFVIVAIIITILMMILSAPFTSIMNAPIEAFDKTVSYVRICSAGTLFIVAYNVIGSIFRGIGDSKTPMITVAIACICNIVLDLVFVGYFKWNTAGAALATILAQAISVVISLFLIKNKKLPFSFNMKDIGFHSSLIKRILYLGFPIALQDGLVNVSFLAIGSIVNSLGLIASAGVGVAEKICGFIMLVPSSFGQSLSAFVAQNIGAGKNDRARKSMHYGMAISFGVGIVISYFSFFHGNLLAGIFSNDSQVILAAAQYLKGYAIDTLFVAFLFCFTGYFNGCGKTTFVMIQGIIGAFLVRIPVSFIMSRFTSNLFLIGLATPCSTIIQILLCFIYYQKHKKTA
ncbi:MAG: MATE family efflux transporter [Erysipelotrichaceae bacterium]|uniref:MATE family efflux transporter n=1 Tax=Floccifex sp. TaxID=2815810 RepID=UPI002A7578A8|nr:MATE family efflux transporter [Floccifex sp.]MDD7282031.1 MATE family efflux transporter [Erysipelotrichaceae bacterium]MDY2957866.1 MATE family efflux transporter [Floccifex sp.]